ncbi:hypothetical protein BGZ83_008606 [Gryganskiella cystojenkinii]|nr:hypothetical protein BGZ83_008606 [Gryganskiella cystojenkinii]
MSQPDPLLLPEILASIAKYVSRGTAINCMRVCKTWKSEFEPVLWRSFRLVNNLYSTNLQPSLELMQKNAIHIRHLVYDLSTELIRPQILRCPQLQTLKFDFEEDLFGSVREVKEIWDSLIEMIENLPMLYKIEIHCPVLSTPVSEKFLKAMLTCPKLVVLETTGLLLSEVTDQYFRSCGPIMRRVASRADEFQEGFTWTDDLQFPELRYLDMHQVSTLSIMDQLEWVVRCPHLISLVWEAVELLPVKKFCELVPTACPNLTCLHLLVPLSDREVSLILNAILRIEKLSVSQSDFEVESIRALRRHFPTLKDINLQHCMSSTGEYVQEIMSSCPNLLSISADSISYAEMMRQSWVCRRLNLFDIGIGVDSDLEHHRAIYAKISELVELEWLSIGLSAMGYMEDDGTVDLSLEAGLDQLKSLTRLEHFHPRAILANEVSKNGFKVVHWMLENWKSLKTLEGYIPHGTPGLDDMLEILTERGVGLMDHADDPDLDLDNLNYGDFDSDGDFAPPSQELLDMVLDGEDEFDDEYYDDYENEWSDEDGAEYDEEE